MKSRTLSLRLVYRIRNELINNIIVVVVVVFSRAVELFSPATTAFYYYNTDVSRNSGALVRVGQRRRYTYVALLFIARHDPRELLI